MLWCITTEFWDGDQSKTVRDLIWLLVKTLSTEFEGPQLLFLKVHTTYTQLLLRVMMVSWCITAEIWDGQQSQTVGDRLRLFEQRLKVHNYFVSPDLLRLVWSVESNKKPTGLFSLSVWNSYLPFLDCRPSFGSGGSFIEWSLFMETQLGPGSDVCCWTLLDIQQKPSVIQDS